jgi:uncharacterized protein
MNQNEDITLVVGASENPSRYSNMAAKRLLEYDYKVKCFGKKAGRINNIEIETQLPEGVKIHTITLYINPTHQKNIIPDLLKLNPKRIIFNPGTENHEFEALAQSQGIETLEACTLVLLATNMYSKSKFK